VWLLQVVVVVYDIVYVRVCVCGSEGGGGETKKGVGREQNFRVPLWLGDGQDGCWGVRGGEGGVMFPDRNCRGSGSSE
jgi:hypothetical protein